MHPVLVPYHRKCIWTSLPLLLLCVLLILSVSFRVFAKFRLCVNLIPFPYNGTPFCAIFELSRLLYPQLTKMSRYIATSKVRLAHLTLSNKKAIPGNENQVSPFYRTPVRQLHYTGNVLILFYWKPSHRAGLFFVISPRPSRPAAGAAWRRIPCCADRGTAGRGRSEDP